MATHPTEAPARYDAQAVARALAPTLRARADELERARRLPGDLSAEFARQGLYRWWVPASYGGLEVPLPESLRALETLASADASAAWCVFISTSTASVLGFLPEASARAVFARPETVLAGVFAPSGRAELTQDGFRVAGQWAFGSNTHNADWICAGCRFEAAGEPLRGPDGAPRQHMVVVPAGEVELLDTWDVAGLRGTGSTDFRIEGAQVPEERVVGYLGRRTLERPLFAFPQFTLLASGFGPIALGLARAALDELCELAGSKLPAGSRRPLAARADTQAAVARAEASLRSARAWLFETLEAAWESAQQTMRVPLPLRRDLRLATSHAVESAVRVVDAMYHLGGGSAIYQRSPLQRIFRDVHTVTQHVMVRPTVFELAGRAYLGIEKDTSFL